MRTSRRCSTRVGARNRVIEDRSLLDIERRTARRKRLGRRGMQVLGNETQPPQRAELQRDPELIRRAPLRAHEPEILAREREEANDVPMVARSGRRHGQSGRGSRGKSASRELLRLKCAHHLAGVVEMQVLMSAGATADAIEEPAAGRREVD